MYVYGHNVFIQVAKHFHKNTSILSILFVERLDLILAACEDNSICENHKIGDVSVTAFNKYVLCN